MAWSLIDSLNAGSSGGGTFTSGSQNTTGATFLFCAVSSFGSATAPTLSDSAGNTWTGNTAQVSSGINPGRVRIFWVDSNTPTTSATHTVTLTGAGAFAAVAFAAFSGSAANPDDQFNTAADAGTTVSASTGITPTQNGSLIVAALTHLAGASPTFAIDSSLTIIETRNYSAGNSYPIVLAWYEQPTAASIDPVWTLGSSKECAVQVASFLPAGGGGGGGSTFNAMLIQP